MFVSKISGAPRGGGLAACLPAILAGALLLCLCAGPARAQNLKTDFSAAEGAARSYCERDTAFARGALEGCRGGLAQAANQVRNIPQAFSSEESCREAEQSLREAAPDLASQHRAWCERAYPDTLQQRGCLEAGRIYLTSLSQGFCPRSTQVITPPPPGPYEAASAAPPALPAQIFDTPKPGRWPGSPGQPNAVKTDRPKTGPPPAQAAPAAVKLPARPATAGQASEPARPAQPAQPGQSPWPGQPTAAPVQPLQPAQPLPQSGGGIPLQVTIPPAGSAPAAAPSRQTTPQSAARQAAPSGGSAQGAAPAGGAPVTLPASALYESGSAPSGASSATPATPAGTTSNAAPSTMPSSRPTPSAASNVSPAALSQPAPAGQAAAAQPAPGQPAPARPNQAQPAPAQTAPSQPAPAGQTSSQPSAAQPAASSGGVRQPGGSAEIPRLNFEGMAPARPTPAPVAQPSSRPPAPGPGLVQTVMPGALPELEPFDENSPEALSFDPGRSLGIRDDSASPLQRFGDSIPNFTRDEMTARQQEDQQAFTYNRGPAGQMGQ